MLTVTTLQAPLKSSEVRLWVVLENVYGRISLDRPENVAESIWKSHFLFISDSIYFNVNKQVLTSSHTLGKAGLTIFNLDFTYMPPHEGCFIFDKKEIRCII
jgi:hypothetical protein